MMYKCHILCLFTAVLCLGFIHDINTMAQECMKAVPADIVLIIDGSGSVGSDGFRESLKFSYRLVDAFKIGPDETQVALIVFDSSAVEIFKFNTHSDKKTLQTALYNTPYPGGGTNIAAGLYKTVDMFSNPSSSGHREQTAGIAVLLTDGKSNIQMSIDAAKRLKSLGVTIYTAGVGSGINETELRQIASDISYFFQVGNYNTLESISGPMASSACSDLDGCFCYHGGTCTPGNFGNKCTCPAIYTGFYCETAICDKSPCFHGTCGVSGDTWHCTCQPGYAGTLCNEDIDECASSPCVYGKCVDFVNRFWCDCTSGYKGTRCEEEIDECESNPCQNDGTCNDSINFFSCQCVAGYTGSSCEIDINECESSPCENGGTCHDWVNAFSCDCPPRFYGFFCETGVCQPSVADIVFVLDSSASQTKEEFEKQLDFVNHFIDHIIVGEKHFQVRVVTYSFKAVTEISLGEFNDNITLKEAVARIKYKPGATFTDKGLQEAIKVFKEAPIHRPYGHIAKRFAFVLTDGLSTNRVSTVAAARKLKSFVNKVLAIGVGNGVSHLELLTIASTENTETGRKYVYSVQNFNALYTVVKELVQLTCEECYWSTSSDVLFLLDMSETVSVDEFQTGLNAISYLVHRTSQMETDNNTVRIGLVTYGRDVQLQRAFDDSETKLSFLSSIQKFELQEGYCTAEENLCGTKSLNDALRFIRQNIFMEIVNQTTETRELLIILSNGKQPITDELMSEVKYLNNNKKYFYVIALGEDANIHNLQKLVGDPALCFSVLSELTVLDALTTELFFSSCDLTYNFLDD